MKTKERTRPTVPEDMKAKYLEKRFRLPVSIHGGILIEGEIVVMDLRWRYGKLDALVAGQYPSCGVGWVEAGRLIEIPH